jgi:dipeptidyl aminopeptidase/acylaminoacyl peptidase
VTGRSANFSDRRAFETVDVERLQRRCVVKVVGLFLSALLLSPIVPADEAIVAPGDNLVVEGVPAIPASIAEQVGRYTEIRGAHFVSWSPVKREMLVSTRFGATDQIHRVATPGAARMQLTFFPENIRGASYNPKTGESFLFRKDKGGNEQYQYYRYDLADGGITLLTDGKSRNTGALWSYGGDRIVYGSTRRNGKDVDLWVVDPRDSKTDRLLAELSGGGWSAADWSPDGRQILAQEGISANETYYWIVDAESGAKRLLTPKGGTEKIAYGGGRFAKDGKGIYLTTDRGSEFQRLVFVDLATGRQTLLTPDTADVDEFDLTRDGRMIAYETNEKGASALHVLDTATGKIRDLAGLPVGVVSDVECHADGRTIGFTFASARSPYDAYSYDVAEGKLERWTFSETGGLNAETFSEPELVRWNSFDGREITGFLYRPPARFTGKRPVLVVIHGGPEGQSRPDFLTENNYFVNELGISVILPNVRGSSGYGKSFLKLDNGFLRENSYKDIRALFDWIPTRPDLDPDRVMVGGGSYGGHMTLAVSTFYADKIRCALDVVGPSNLVTFLENTSGYRQDLRRVEYGDERDPKMRALLEKIAPAKNAEKIKKPLFVVQGANDPRVPRTESEQMVAILRKQGTPVWYLLAKDEGHGFNKKPNKDFELYATVLFMKQYLLN